MSLISRALYIRKYPERHPGVTLTRRQMKALAQHDADTNKKTGFAGSYKRKTHVTVLDYVIDPVLDLLIPTETSAPFDCMYRG